jgi:BCCT family betaine/carnitine transporter
MATNSIGFMAVNYVRMSTWTDPLTDSGFVEDWTVFYWAWWVAVGPFMGIFVARISEGRTIRQIVLGMLSLGTLGSAVYYSILGNYALFLELEGLLPVTQIVAEQGEPAAIVQVVASLPMGTVLLAVFCVASLVFLATTYDSASYTLASSTTESLQGEQEPARWLRLFWAVVLGILPIALMQIGGLEPLKTASLVASLPLLVVFLLMGISLWLSLRDDRPPGTGGL